jgi:hypothetical protein
MTKFVIVRAISAVSTAMVILAAAGTASALPPFTNTVPYRSGAAVTGVGTINSPFNPGLNGGNGFKGAAINSSGLSFVHAGIFANPGYDEVILRSDQWPVPYLAAGVESPLAGSVSVPSIDYVVDDVYCESINNNGVGAFVLRLRAGEFSSVTPITGVYFNKTAMPIKEGDAVTASGVAPGTVFAAFGASTSAHINDSNVCLIACNIVESGQSRRALLKVALDAGGAVLSQTLVAKETGPVGAGPATWTLLSTTKVSCAINNSGQVLFSGITSTGTDGLYLTSGAGGSFVATSGGATPTGGIWTPLTGAPADLNNNGSFAFRGIVRVDGSWNESADAGEGFGGLAGNCSTGAQAQPTAGGGTLDLIAGMLTNDQDVDVYSIRVGDSSLANQAAFSATLVPDPGSGFAGANFDSVMHLFTFSWSNNGNTRAGISRSDDAAPGVVQSALSTFSLPPSHVPGTNYFLAVSTPKVRVTGGCGSFADMWTIDPTRLAFAGGILYWVDPSTGTIARADAATGATLPSVVNFGPPQQTCSCQSVPGDGQLLDNKIAIYDAGANSKLVFRRQAWGQTNFVTANLDGSGVNLVTLGNASPTAFFIDTMAVDSLNGKIYWSTPSTTQTAINRCNIDGSGNETVVTPVDTCNCDFYRVTALAIDTFGTGRVYWYESLSNRIVYENLTDLPDLSAAHLHPVLFGANVKEMTIDSAARKLYFITNGNGGTPAVRVMDLNTHTLLPNIATTASPQGIAMDPAGGKVYWSSPYERLVRRSSVTTPAVEDWLAMPAEVGEVLSNGPASMNGFNHFERMGTAGSTPLPYQLKLTGATFLNPSAMVCRNNSTKVVAVGDTIPTGTVGAIGSATGAIRISDRGLVAWAGSASASGVYLNTDQLFNGASNIGGVVVGNVEGGGSNLDMSSSGQYLVASCFNGSFSGPGQNFVQVSFDSVPGGCLADFNNSGAVTVQDIFDFLAAYFTSAPAADINGSGAVTVQDIFDFLALYFAGCP